MRFKKLKISVGIALVLFILITGSIISIGFWQNQGLTTSKETPVLELSTPVYSDNTSSTQTQTNTNSTLSTPVPPPTPKPVVVQTPVRTRAS